MKDFYIATEATKNSLFSSGSPESVALGLILIRIIIAIAVAIVFFCILAYVISIGVEKGIKRYVDKNKNQDLSLLDSHIIGSILEADNIKNNKNK